MLYLPNTIVTISTTVSGTPAAAGSERKQKRMLYLPNTIVIISTGKI